MDINQSATSIVIVGTRPPLVQRLRDYLDPQQPVSCCHSADEALALVAANKTQVALVVADISSGFDMAPAEFISAVKRAGYAEVVFCYKPNLNPDSDVPVIVSLSKQGAFDMLSFPDFKDLFSWVVDRAIDFFQLKMQVLSRSTKDDYPQRINAFFDLLQTRKSKGLAITESEIKLFFPETQHPKMPLDTLLETVNKPPLRDYRDIQVLLADDEDHFRDAIDMMLEPYGYSIHEANCGKAVLDKINTTKLDVILLDVALGDMTGDELVPLIKQAQPQAEIIMVTAFKDMDLIVNTVKDGAFDFVVKGKRLELLPQKISQAVQKQHFGSAISAYLEQL